MDACDGSSSGMGYPNEGSKPPNASDPFFSSGWDPISSLTQTQFQHYPYPPPPIWDNQLITSHSTPELPHYQPESNFLGLQNLISRDFPKMVGSFGPISNSPNYGEETRVRASKSQECRNSEEEQENKGSPSNERRRKRSPESSSPYDPNKNNEGEVMKHPSDDDSDVLHKEQSEKKQRTESGSSRGKQSSKQVKEDSDSGDAPKDNYIHVRARRGQATNSHSLAERLRREKISERMRLLQELVPGCNKITGKAVMLDEIINYVQSLQQQVEFLSMKLATLIPDLSIDLERALTKEVLHSHGRDALVRGLGPGALPYAQGIFQGAIPTVSSTSQYPPFPQGQLETELQTLFQLGFDSSSAMDFLKSNARLKPEP